MFSKARSCLATAVLVSAMGMAGQALAIGGFFGTMNNAVSMYNNVKAGVQIYHTRDMVKSVLAADPLFRDYDNVMVRVQVYPRDTESGQDISSAFEENVHYIIDNNMQISGEYLRVCESDCVGKTLVLQFREKGYDSNIIQRFTVGDKLRGELYYMDHTNAELLRVEKLEIAENYEMLLREINLSVVSKLIKSMNEHTGKKGNKEMEALVEKYNTFDPVMPEYRELFAAR